MSYVLGVAIYLYVVGVINYGSQVYASKPVGCESTPVLSWTIGIMLALVWPIMIPILLAASVIDVARDGK